ncbi:hypothetical protein A7K93_04405 [Candidatus Methylacidiphilum fumarolicum]|uniref:Uncharacterized protein n=2 Tax=Candidatus Methylacidiphilum fumarolicum TaxID=591154 RepID=I0JZ63_METFB|nr:hypothetical protein [Candidatus Methylacidiphilum fumarolicum]MBW6414687.1 hypothetical protein [Candidatus Methylacidiphilum fumarolicum]TFE70174.1 hypothetical protein A7K73_04670 [Candidatus Methylacidiphilum fumarolicum]TFE74259.1 hypothetical protein A7K93_04405 [Candidatus Methylacidiphilum fumarolicum]TFE75758.1 hypothetical protein A7K72_01085 [Candidatus Methylacidiphilum fumarolicum]TFE75917.1 hypothetical protein A7D33_01290 [Candidatus Methylacidiphilum fumarolicum]
MGKEKKVLSGEKYVFSSDSQKIEILEAAFDYRGDVTLELVQGETIEGYLFNRQLTEAPFFVEMLVPGEESARRIPIEQICAVTFSGKDPADGKSYEAWKAKKEKERREEAKKIESEMKQAGLLD